MDGFADKLMQAVYRTIGLPGNVIEKFERMGATVEDR